MRDQLVFNVLSLIYYVTASRSCFLYSHYASSLSHSDAVLIYLSVSVSCSVATGSLVVSAGHRVQNKTLGHGPWLYFPCFEIRSAIGMELGGGEWLLNVDPLNICIQFPEQKIIWAQNFAEMCLVCILYFTTPAHLSDTHNMLLE